MSDRKDFQQICNKDTAPHFLKKDLTATPPLLEALCSIQYPAGFGLL
jgi:hypothetical protein